MSVLLRTFLAGAGLVAGAAAGFFATHLRGDSIDQPLAHPYQPLSAGATWTYEVRQRHGSTGDLPDSTVTERVTGLLVDRDRVVADLEASIGATAARPTHTIVLTKDGVLPEVEVTTQGAALRAVGSRGVYLPVRLVPGMRWTYEVEFAGAGSDRTVVTARLEAVGTQRLEVPAGIFEVVHIRRELGSADHQQIDDLYYAREVGLVAATTTTAAGYRSDRLLKAYSAGTR